MKKIVMILAVTTTIFFTACGGGSGGHDSSTSPRTSTKVSMVPNQTYTIHSGQSISKDSTPTEVIVETDTNTGETEAILKSGSASIITQN